MDPVGTLLSIASILRDLQDLSDSYAEAPATLVSIQSQIRIVQSGVNRINEWLHFTDPTSRAQVQESLQESIAAVDASVRSLHEDLQDVQNHSSKAIKVLGRQGSDQWTKTKFALNEPRIRKHLTDMRELALLMSFTLTVCQLPTGPPAEQAVKELGTCARTLSRAHKSTRENRQSMFTKAKVQVSEEHSVEFEKFIEGVLDAEKGLPEYVETEQAFIENDLEGRTVSHKASRDPSVASTEFEDTARTSPLESPKSRPGELFHDNIKSEQQGKQPHHDQDQDKILSQSPFTGAAPRDATLPETHQHNNETPGLARSRTEKSPKFPADAPGMIPIVMPGNGPARTISRKPLRAPSKAMDRKLDRHLGDTRSSEKIMVVANDTVTPEKPTLIWPMSSLPESVDEPQADLSPASEFSHRQDFDNETLTSSPPPYITPVSRRAPERAVPSGDSSASPVDSAQLPIRALRSQSGQNLSKLHSIEDVDCPELIQGVRTRLEDFVRVLLEQGTDTEVREKSTGRTALLEAVYLSQREICRLIIKAGGRPNQTDNEGRTALHVAATQNDTILCRMLLDAGAHADAYDKAGCTPLRLAAQSGSDEVAACLLALIPSKKANDPEVIRAFLDAVKHGDIATTMEFLAKHVNLKTIKDPWKPIANAAQSGSLQMLDLVAVQKAGIKGSDPDGFTVLHHAAQYGHHAMVERLLDMGASWKAQTKQRKETALHLAIAARHNATAQFLVQHKDAKVTMSDADDQEPIHLATRTGDFDLVASLSVRGAKLKTKSEYGWKPVHLASAYGHVSLMADFITHGIDIEDRLATPSFKPHKKTNEAARRGYWAEIRWPHEEARPLHLAIEFGHVEMTKLLLNSGAKVDAADSQRWQPLHYAAFHCQPEIVELLLDRGASSHATTQDGNTPLGLGFREHGLGPTAQEDKERVQFLLQEASLRQPKSPFAQVVQFRLGGAGTRTARERNQVWHTAEMAEALYRDRTAEGDDFYAGDGESQVSLGSGQLAQDVSSPALSSGWAVDRRTSTFSLRKSST